MHELSLSYATVETALAALAPLAVKRVKQIRVVAGDFSGVAIEAFRFSFPIAAAGTLLEGAELVIEREPVTIWCAPCAAVRELPSVTRFRCPVCDEPSGDLRSGRDFLSEALEVEEEEHEHAHR